MQLQSISLSFFRSYEALDLSFCGGLNCFFGNNGLGKTNILEAIHYLALTKGLRGQADKFSLKEGELFFMTAGTFLRDKKKVEVECNFHPGKGRKMLIDRKPLGKMSEHIGFLPLISVVPEDIDLVQGGASSRRRFMDSLISQYDHAYLDFLIRYERALQHRNALLDRMKEENRFAAEELEPWTEELISCAVPIHASRNQFLEFFLPLMETYFDRIVSSSEKPNILYISQVKENVETHWRKLFADKLKSDRYTGRTQAGIHKEDLQFLINGHEVKNFGSQGQTKTFVVALKLAQYRLLEKNTGLSPLLLLDDLFDRLDQERLRAIAEILDAEIKGQVFLTDAIGERVKKAFPKKSKSEIRFFEIKSNAVIQS